MFQEDIIKIGDNNINYLKVGNGPHNVLCVPGALGSIWTNFKPQIEGFDREMFTLVAWDPPGYGKSRPPEKDFRTDFYERDADCAYELMKALKLPKYSILGWCDGGAVGMILAAKHPEVVEKLVVWASKAFILPRDLLIYDKYRDVNEWSLNYKSEMVEVYGEHFASYWAKWTDNALYGMFKAKNGDICLDRLKAIKCPTFILYGEQDPLTNKDHAIYLHNHIENSRLHKYPAGKHNVHLKYADDFNRRVQDFLLEPK
ncbi:valacyclovir hydrolase-like [Galleria mellonella]|uniref:Valacyclovir hydrolase-like n=1 Tax=Galleria mellonella TaxID=7137 RepID=A0A6J3BU29_GALME|nr:valacyclovir hydrolase-like [Galleria mellonella]